MNKQNQISITRHPAIIFDACCLLNIYASDCIEDILKSMNCSIAVSEYVKLREATFIFDQGIKTPVNIDEYVSDGLISIEDVVTEEESEFYVNYAVDIDDGESITGAIARARGWAIACDDKKALRIFRNSMDNEIFTTPDIIHYWSCTPTDDQIVRSAIRQIEIRGKYRPPNNHIHTQWWNELAKK